MMQNLTPYQRVVIFFTGVGALIGIVSAFIPNAWVAFLLMLVCYYLTYKQIYQILKIQPSEIPRGTVAKSGFFPYLVAWLVAWIWVYSLLLV